MAQAEQAPKYDLIETIPGTLDEVQAELERHSLVLKANSAGDSYDAHNAKVLALANINMLLDGVVSHEAFVEAVQSVGPYAAAA